MSYASISHNQTAVGYIDDAIKEYREALKKIQENNSNTLADELVKEIDDTIGYLEGLKGNINSLNSRISQALHEKEERERRLAEEKE